LGSLYNDDCTADQDDRAMAEQRQLRRGAFTGLAVFVGAAAGILAGLLGGFAALAYGGLDLLPRGAATTMESLSRVGVVWGALTGVIAAAMWCWVMFHRVACGRTERLTAWGAWSGLLAGVFSTVLLHVGLMVTAGTTEILGMLLGLVFGVPVGAILGAISGAICQNIARPRSRQP
jgi:hypothetical protein